MNQYLIVEFYNYILFYEKIKIIHSLVVYGLKFFKFENILNELYFINYFYQ